MAPKIGSGEGRIDKIGDIDFSGQIGKQVAKYARETQLFARDLAYTLDNDAARARKAMLRLHGHPLLAGIDVRIRTRLVTQKLKRARKLARGISAEAVKYQMEYRKQFVITGTPKKDQARRNREVDL